MAYQEYNLVLEIRSTCVLKDLENRVTRNRQRGHTERMKVRRGSSSNAFFRLIVVVVMLFSTLTTMMATSWEVGATTNAAESPVSASFLPSGEGWILSSYPCKTGTCVKVEKTLNKGRSWASIPLPSRVQKLVNETVSNYFPFVQLNIYFTNARDGWIYGSAQPGTSSTGTYVTPEAELWSTQDGGETWHPLRAGSLGMKFNILSVSASRGQVYAIAWLSDQTFGLWRSSIMTNSWTRVPTPILYSAAGGTSMEGALVFKGANGWLMVGNDRAVTGSARLASTGRWIKWTAPCESVGGNFAVPVATTASTLVDVCTIGGYGGYIPPAAPHYLKIGSNWIFTSRDGGLTFKPASRVVVGNSSEWLSQLPGLPASPAPGVVLVAKSVSTGQKLSDHLYLTNNGGRTWISVYSTPLSSLAGTIQLVAFASSSLGSAVVQTTPTTSILIVSTDGGRTWRKSAI